MGDNRLKIEQRILREVLRMCAMLGVALLQTALAPALWQFRIDWVLVVAVTLALARNFASGLRCAAYGGVALDILSPLPFGTHLLGLVVAVTLATVGSEAIRRENLLVPTVAMLLVSLVYAAIAGAVMTATGLPVNWGRYPLTIMVPTALVNGIAALPAYLLFERFQRKNRPDIGWEL
jgi:rod shape-determining protein MreD